MLCRELCIERIRGAHEFEIQVLDRTWYFSSETFVRAELYAVSYAAASRVTR